MTPAAFAGSYADIKLVKTRSVFQVVVELPIEQYQPFVAAFGGPLPGSERPVALALLNTSPGNRFDNDEQASTGQLSAEAGKADKPKVPWIKMPRAQRAGILCNDPRFQTWATDRMELEMKPDAWPDNAVACAASYIRWRCGVKSRAELDNTDEIATRFDLMESIFRQDNGLMAEAR